MGNAGSGERSYVRLPGARVAALCAASDAAVASARKRVRDAVDAALWRSALSSDAAWRASWTHRLARWWGTRRGTWAEPPRPVRAEAVATGRAALDDFDPLFWDLYRADRLGEDALRASARLARAAREVGPAGEVRVAAADLAALWGYAPPARERGQ